MSGMGEGESEMVPPGHHLDRQYCSSDDEFEAGNCRGCEKLCMSGSRYAEDEGRNMACKASCCAANDCTDGSGNNDDSMPENDDSMPEEEMSGMGEGEGE